MSEPLLEIRDLCISFTTPSCPIQVVDGVSLSVNRGQTLALVGESGCGKSVTALSVLRLLPPLAHVDKGEIWFNDLGNHSNHDYRQPKGKHRGRCKGKRNGERCNLLNLEHDQLRNIRGNRIAIIFQEPMSTLNPVISIGKQMAEAILSHRDVRQSEANRRTIDLLQRVGIPNPSERASRYPHQMSGGMLQRVLIAMALACEPALLIADEPTTAIDVTIQKQIFHLLRSLQEEFAMSILFISHDLGVVGEIAHQVAVMYAGSIVEQGNTARTISHPIHPYTQALLRSMPILYGNRSSEQPSVQSPLTTIEGTVPRPGSWPTGCRFHPRCPLSELRAKDPNRESITLPGPDGTMSEGKRVLLDCTKPNAPISSDIPDLRETSIGHKVACWEI